MIRPPPRFTRTDPPFPYTTPFRSTATLRPCPRPALLHMPEERQDRCRRYAGDPRCRAQAGRPGGAQKLLNLSREAPDLAVVQARRQHQGLILAEGPNVGLLSKIGRAHV